MNRPRLEHPPPHLHLAGTLDLVRRIASLSTPHPCLPAVLRLLDRPETLPESIVPEADALKYDVYRSEGARAAAWGLTINDLHERDGWHAEVERFVASLPGKYALSVARTLRDSAPANFTYTLGIGFDDPVAPPRLKLYLQEARWNQSRLDASRVSGWLAHVAPGCVLPNWIAPDRAVGVVTLELFPDERTRFKIYLGGESALAAAAGAPLEVERLAQALDTACPLAGLFHYVTVRLAPGEPPRYALNKIYNSSVAWTDDGGEGLRAAWGDVERLFDRVGRAAAFRDLEAALSSPGLKVAPTATAIEDEARSADLYCAAWRTP